MTPRGNGFITACPAEKSGRDEFDFEYGSDFARHIEEFNPTFCKVLVHYNPEGDPEAESATSRTAEAVVRLPAAPNGRLHARCSCPPGRLNCKVSATRHATGPREGALHAEAIRE